MAPHTRPRPTSIDLLPEECEGIVAWAAQELARTVRSQTDVYGEFRRKLIALQGELGLGFDIPAFSSFNRHNIRLAKLHKRLQRSQMMADAIVERTDGEDADKVTQAATRTLKTLILEMLEGGDAEDFTPKQAMEMANTLRSLQIAENLSTARRQRVEAEFSKKAEKAIEKVSSELGLSADRIAQLRQDFLGVRPKAASSKPKSEPDTGKG